MLQPDFDHLVPADKKLSAAWLRSLTERGTPAVYHRDEFRYIGMPIGGITTGQLYLSGDGRLWHWDIFNLPPKAVSSGGHYAHPVEVQSSVEQGFSICILNAKEAKPRVLSAEGFTDVTFCGQYPIGIVEYRDPACPLSISLEAFSPFIPLNVDDSSLPATVMRFTLTNNSDHTVEAELSGTLQNAVARSVVKPYEFARHNRVTRDGKTLLLQCGATGTLPSETEGNPPIVFATFEGTNFEGWTVQGKAFGNGPARGATAENQSLSNFEGTGLANSLLNGSDQPTGRLTSSEFQIRRRFINFLIGGGNHPKQTCINLIIDGKIARTQTGKNSDTMEWATWDVADLAGQQATIEVVDQSSDSWGHIDIDQIEFADTRRVVLPEFTRLADVGTMGLVLLDATDRDSGQETIEGASTNPATSTSTGASSGTASGAATGPSTATLTGALTRKFSIAPGKTHIATFAVVWCFPNLSLKGIKGSSGRHYATRFQSAGVVGKYLAANFDRLYTQTKLWRDNWYDSTLPHWLLDRTLLNTSILASSTAYRFSDGRFYGWEGVYSCAGTCTHVWQYEQAMGRLFPELDILLRERAEFNPNIGFKSDGMIDHRGEFHAGQAVDGQAGTILRCLRDHQTSSSDLFLKRNWPSIKKATQWLIAQDANRDGILEGPQHNTLDAEWYGPVAWLSGIYLASLRAAEEMAKEVGDMAFADECRAIFDPGTQNFTKLLFDGDYFINRPDPQHLDAINSGSGCEIDQVLGQSWAFQVGLGRVISEKQTKAALASIWKYNFSPDVGPYRDQNKPGRWYAMAGEAGLLMCSFPRTDWDYEKAKGKGAEWAAGYFNECMNGFEHQVAGHMLWEGMVTEGLAIERALHDRYHPSKRNPWNEIECGDHYARSMASYGVFIAASGFEFHGPKGYMAFAPRLSANDFRSAFTAAAGWGSFSQQITTKTLKATVDIKSGTLMLNTLALDLPSNIAVNKVMATIGDTELAATCSGNDGRVIIQFAASAMIEPGKMLSVVVG